MSRGSTATTAATAYLADSEHACPRLTLAQGFALALTLGVVCWVLIVAGFWTPGWLPGVPW